MWTTTSGNIVLYSTLAVNYGYIVPRKWVYLEPIFGRGALPKEQGRFKRVDDDFR